PTASIEPPSLHVALPISVRARAHVASWRRPGLARPDARRGQVRAHLSLRPGGVRPVLPGEHDRLAHAHAAQVRLARARRTLPARDRKSTRLNSSHVKISY